MKTLILVRHAKTEQLVDYTQSDFDRKLLSRGRNDSKLVAQELVKKGYEPDLFISSNAKRAKQTAKIFAKYLNYKEYDIRTEQFIYNGYTTNAMLDYLSAQDNGLESIIVFGHNPDIANLTVNLINESIFHFPTGVATAIKFNIDRWDEIEVRQGMLGFYVYPSALK